MATLAQDIYTDQFNQCRALYDEGRYEECYNLGAHNLSDSSTPRYLKIKTLILLVGAVDDWHHAEGHRISAERLYRTTKSLMAEQEFISAAKDEAMVSVRKELDDLLEWQADDAPPEIQASIATAVHPPRPGRMKDFLYARYLKEHPEVTPRDNERANIHNLKFDFDSELDDEEGHDEDDIELEDSKAVQEAEDKMFGKDENITEKIQQLHLARLPHRLHPSVLEDTEVDNEGQGIVGGDAGVLPEVLRVEMEVDDDDAGIDDEMQLEGGGKGEGGSGIEGNAEEVVPEKAQEKGPKQGKAKATKGKKKAEPRPRWRGA